MLHRARVPRELHAHLEGGLAARMRIAKAERLDRQSKWALGAQALLRRPDRLLHCRRQLFAHRHIERREVQILGEAVIGEEQLLERRPSLEDERLGQRRLDREPRQHVAQRIVALHYLWQYPRLRGRLLQAQPQRPLDPCPGLNRLLYARLVALRSQRAQRLPVGMRLFWIIHR